MPSHLPGWECYPHRHLWEDIVRHGVRPSWLHPFPKQDAPPKNHASAVGALNAIVKSIRKGQAAGQYLVLDIDMLNLLEGITCSPFGAVQKGDSLLTTEARMIHDLSFPANSSVNDNTVDDASVEVSYDGPQSIARRILEVEAEFPGKAKMMSGDVAGAFRHIPIHADHVGRFAGTIQELGVLIIDLACPFGWTQSPMQYWIAGAAISHLYASTAPQWPRQPIAASGKFVTKTWCDDHNCIEADIGSRTAEANLALRRSMIAVLGPDSINENKFTPWAHRGKALGLLWDIPASSMAMPPTKIAKAVNRIDGVLAATSTSKTLLNRLLGSLRHVVTCVRAAAPFFQQLASLCRSSRRTSSILISSAARDDLAWFHLILQIADLNAIPFTRFTQAQPVDFEIFMDASDVGLCAIFPAHQHHAILLRGIRRFSSPVTKQYPLSAQLLRIIAQDLDLKQARLQLLWGGILLGYFFLLRRSEYLHIGRRHHGYILRLGDISFLNSDGQCVQPRAARRIGIKLMGAKNNQYGREEVRYLDKSGDKVLCPIKAARWIEKGAKHFGTRSDQPALSTRQSHGITAKEVARTIKTAASRVGLDPTRFSTHSIRIGGATALLNSGADRLAIKLLGRWLSNTYEEYPVLTAEGNAVEDDTVAAVALQMAFFKDPRLYDEHVVLASRWAGRKRRQLIPTGVLILQITGKGQLEKIMEGDDAWSFMIPWCAHVLGHVQYKIGEQPDPPGQFFCGLMVNSPRKDSCMQPDDEAERQYTRQRQQLREALALLALVAHVDSAAWKRLLETHCDVRLMGLDEVVEGEFTPRFMLELPVGRRIAADDYNNLSIAVGLRPLEVKTELAKLMESLARDGIRCSGLAFRQDLGSALAAPAKKAAARKAVGHLYTSLFGGARSQAIASGAYQNYLKAKSITGPSISLERQSNELAVHCMHFHCSPTQNWVFERLCSAAAVNQTTTNVSLQLDEDTEQHQWRWQWIGYAFFSERARMYSSLQGLTLQEARITGEDVEAMASVLTSNGPEEDLFGLLHQEESSDVSIKANVAMKLLPVNAEETLGNSTSFTVWREITGAKLLSNDGDSKWVDVLVPGFGKCQTQRTNLLHRSDALPLGGVKSLVIKFKEDPNREVLRHFLTLIASSVQHLTLQFANFDTSALESIVVSCPILRELSVCTPSLEARFCVRGSNRQHLILSSPLNGSFEDVGTVSRMLCLADLPLTKCLRRLRVHMDEDDEFGREIGTTLLIILRLNRTLEYLHVVVQRQSLAFLQLFRAHHLEVLPVVKTELSLKSKLAFLSVIAASRRNRESSLKRKTRRSKSVSRLCELNQHVINLIFAFAAAPAVRKVYYHANNDTRYEPI
ncbi:hypothetical protein BBJ28_00011833 [Nothophytophthora sp. Chile5]|nr:hypothetical protein BBJ28_00011833 [Nothophytophthora sp. Chile5]